MGLRIIERHPKPRHEASDSERQTLLEASTRTWALARGGDEGKERMPPSQLEQLRIDVLRNYRTVQARMAAEEPADGALSRIRTGILNLNNDSALPHNQVDITTLLELL
jgi:hypothetical protein